MLNGLSEEGDGETGLDRFPVGVTGLKLGLGADREGDVGGEGLLLLFDDA